MRIDSEVVLQKVCQWPRRHLSYPKFCKQCKSIKSWERSSGSRIPRGKKTGKWAIDGSLIGGSGRDAACGWAVAQLDYDKEEEPPCAICGTMLAGLEAQRTIKGAELLSGPTGIIDHSPKQYGRH